MAQYHMVNASTVMNITRSPTGNGSSSYLVHQDLMLRMLSSLCSQFLNLWLGTVSCLIDTLPLNDKLLISVLFYFSNRSSS